MGIHEALTEYGNPLKESASFSGNPESARGIRSPLAESGIRKGNPESASGIRNPQGAESGIRLKSAKFEGFAESGNPLENSI